MKNIFDWLKEINFLKSPVSKFSNKDWDLWNSYMIHRFLSMNKDFLDIVNEVQSINPQNKKEIYTIYREFIPVNNKWNKYIKSSTKQPNNELLSYLSEHWECSKSEIREYLNILDNDTILSILKGMGFDKKEITKLLK